MLLKEYRQEFIASLLPFFDEKEVESFFTIALEAFHKMSRVDLALDHNFEIDAEQLSKWESVLGALKKQKPIQYIIGETAFFGLSFYVDENTLIPRPETEELVDWIINENSKNQKFKNLKILDIGTGSGCIAIALAKNIPTAKVFAIDVCEKALAVAQKNALRNNVEIIFIQKNVLKTIHLEEQFDIIVSNPPYVRQLEKSEIHQNVLEYEPHLALFVENNDALLFYRKIADLAKKNLTRNGELYFEINQYLGKEMLELLEKKQFKNIKLKKDIYGNDRMTRCII
jgi:release factor glutamine methyltransferase